MNMKQPTLFISHGSPMMALDDSPTSRFLKQLGTTLSKPKAIVVFSAHFDVPGDIVITAGARPETIHDFGGFPQELYEVEYPAPGARESAKDIAARFEQAGLQPILDKSQGWDHGVWVPLRLMFPEAEIPVVAVSINSRLGAETNYAFGKLLASLKDENILIIGSGSITHNLREIYTDARTPKRLEMSEAFTSWIYEKLMAKDTDALLDYREQAPFVRFNHPSQEHFLPLIAAMGSSDLQTVERLHQGFEAEILGMDAYRFN